MPIPPAVNPPAVNPPAVNPAVAIRPMGPLARRNPALKLGLLFAVSAGLVFILDPVTPAVLYLLALAAVVATARIRTRFLVVAQLPFVAFGAGLLVVNALSRPGDVVWEAGILRITVEGLVIGASLALRTLVIGILSVAFVLTTEPVSLMTSLHQHARVGARVTYAILAGYRMLQEMPREWVTIRQAHAVRAPLRADGSLPRGVGALARAAFSLLVVSVRKGERMAQSLESRGLGLEPRSTWRPVPLGAADWVMVGGVIVVLIAVVVCSSLLGYLDGPAALFG